MKLRFILFRRAGVFYSEDTTTGKQISLRTKDEAEALTLLHSKNEAHRQPVLNFHIARTYLTATEPEIAKRTWQAPMDEMTRTKTGPTITRCKRATQHERQPNTSHHTGSPGQILPHLMPILDLTAA